MSVKAHDIHDWWIETVNGRYMTVDTINGKIVQMIPSTHRDIAQATMKGKFK